VPYQLPDGDPFHPKTYSPPPDRFFQVGDALGVLTDNANTSPPSRGLTYRQASGAEVRNGSLGSDADSKDALSASSGCFAFWKSVHYNHSNPKQPIKPIIAFEDGLELSHQGNMYRVAKHKHVYHEPLNPVDLRATALADERNWEHLALQWDEGWMAIYLNGVLIQAVPFKPPTDKIFALPARIGCKDMDVSIRAFTMYSRRLSDKEITQLAHSEIPTPTRLWETKYIKRGLIPLEAYDETGFDDKYLFGDVPEPGQYPRLLFSAADLPVVRQMMSQTQRGRAALERAEAAMDGQYYNYRVFQDVSRGKSFRRHYPNIGKVSIGLEYMAKFAFAHLLVDPSKVTAKRREELATATLTIFREVKEDVLKIIEDKKKQPKRNTVLWNDISQHMGREQLAYLLDFAGHFMAPEQLRECENFLIETVGGLRTIETHWMGGNLDVEEQRQKVLWNKRYRFLRRDSNKSIWLGSELFTYQLLVHGLHGANPGDAYYVGLAIEVQNRGLNTELGMQVESQGKEAHWRGFLPWLAYARLKLPGLAYNPYAHPQNRNFISGKAFLCAPFDSFAMDNGSWAHSQMRPQLSMFAALFPRDAPSVWYSRLVYQTPPKLKRIEEKGVPDWNSVLPRVLALYSNPEEERSAEENCLDKTCLKDVIPLRFSDADVGYFVSHASLSPDSTSLYCSTQDLSGGHVKKVAGSFDVAGMGTLWVCSPVPFTVVNTQCTTVLIDGKCQPGVNGAETGLYVGAKQRDNVAGCVMETTFAYRHVWRYHEFTGNGVKQDEPQFENDSLNVKQAFRTMLTFRLAQDRSLILCIDDITMLDDKEHTYGWHFNFPVCHTIADKQPGHITLKGWGGEKPRFGFSKTVKGAKCVVRVVDDEAVDENTIGVLYGHQTMGQSSPKEIYTQPQGEYQTVYSKTCTFTRRSRDGRFIVAICPYENGEQLPEIKMKGTKLVIRSPDKSQRWVVRLKGESHGFCRRVVDVVDHFSLDW